MFSGSDRAGRSISESQLSNEVITFLPSVSRFGDRTRNDNFRKVTKNYYIRYVSISKTNTQSEIFTNKEK